MPEPEFKTPKKVAAEERKPVSKLPQAKPTPLNKKTSQAHITHSVTKTPSDYTLIVPDSREMHPVHHHATTAGEYDEARWLGFQSIAPHTALRKGTARSPSTPTKTPQPARGAQNEISPEFSFRIKSPFSMLKGPSNLSPRTRNILDAAPMGGTPGAGARAIFTTNEFSTKADMIPDRKKAAPKGKMARFSDVHIAEFKKMDSIANHPSAFRADPKRFKPVIGQSLKKSPSRAEVTKPEPNKLKRTQSKMDVAESSSKNTGSLKRTQSKMDMTENVARIPPSVTLKRTQSKMDLQGSGLPRSASTIRLVATAGDDRPVSRDGPLDQGAKRVKRTESDDAGTSRPVSRHGLPAPTATPARKITSQTALPRLAARLMTPTKASLARATQSAKPIKSTSMIPSLTKTPTKKSLFSPTNLARNLRDRAEEGMRQASQNLSRVRSILRTPSRKFSDDPAKVAAGTHMSPPPVPNYQKALPVAPATAPVKKHVNFTNSTLERSGEVDFGKSPSPMKFRAGSEMPAGAVVYPTLQPDVEYPELPAEVSKNITSPSRRLTFGDKSMDKSNEFNFESGKFVNFGPASAGTIRMVRKSEASTLIGDKKRKLTTLQETSDKENDEPAEDDGRSSKKVKPTPAEPPKTPVGTSKLPRRTPGRGGSAISKSRLNFLATPKRTRV